MSDLPPGVHLRGVTALVGACAPDELVVVGEAEAFGEPAAMCVYSLALLDPELRRLLEEAPGGRKDGDVLIVRRGRAGHLIVNFAPEVPDGR